MKNGCDLRGSSGSAKQALDEAVDSLRRIGALVVAQQLVGYDYQDFGVGQ